MKKSIILVAVLALLIAPNLVKAEAISIIRGMSVTSYNSNHTVYANNVTAFTDGDLSTSGQIRSSGGYVDFVLDQNYKVSAFSQNGGNLLNVIFYDENNVEISRSATTSNNGVVRNIEPVVGVKKIRFQSQGLGSVVNELNVFGEPQSPPPQVSQIVAQPLSDREIKLSWQVPDGASVVEIRLNDTVIATVPRTENTYTVSGLTGNTQYKFSFISMNDDTLRSQPVHIYSSTLEIDKTPPQELKNLKSFVYADWIKFTWENPSDVDFYEVRIFRDGRQIGVANAHTNYFVDIGLTQHTTYTFLFRSVDTNGNASEGISVTETTKGVPRGSINIIGQAWESSAELTWSKNVEATKYFIYQDGVKVSESEDTKATIVGLINGQTYVFSIVSANEWGEGQRSNELELTPISIPVPDRPANVSYTASNDAITLSWGKVNYARSYKVYMTETKDDSLTSLFFDIAHADSLIEIGETTGTSYTIGGLSQNKEYQFFVSATNEKGESERAQVTARTTNEIKVEFTALELVIVTIQFILIFANLILLILGVKFAPRIIRFLQELSRKNGVKF